MFKTRVASFCLGLLVSAPLAVARPADAPLTQTPMVSANKGEAVLRRGPRPLLRSEVFRVIQNDLAKMGISAGVDLRPEDLRIQYAPPVLRDDLGLQVKRIAYDSIRREAVFELWASNEPQFLPFQVTTRRLGLEQIPSLNRGEVGGRAKQAHAGSSSAGPGLNRGRSQAPVLAKPGRPATLVMLGQNLRITTTVLPLQPGSKGQCIRVRDPVTWRILTAEVVDEGLLRAAF